MAATEIPVLTLSVLATAALTAGRFVTPAGAVAGAGAAVAGICNSDTAIGEMAPVIALGVGIATSGAAVAVGAVIGSDAAGKAITWVSGEKLGVALTATTGADQELEVLMK